jgi:vanillate O-demethylase monooxygenase subunit
MGEEANVDVEALPHQEWMDHPDWASCGGYLHVKGSYVHLHENLLDLSHLSFLHSGSFGTPEYARAPAQTTIDAGDIQVWRHVECQLPPIYAKPLGWVGARARRSSGSQFVAPGLHVNTGVFCKLEQAEEALNRRAAEDQDPIPSRPATDRFPSDPSRSATESFPSDPSRPAIEGLPSVKVAQLITPETHHSTHYWYAVARNFALGDAAMGEFILEQQRKVFSEDAFALERITELLLLEGSRRVHQISLPTDKAGVMMRRHLKYLAELERARTSSPAAPG